MNITGTSCGGVAFRYTTLLLLYVRKLHFRITITVSRYKLSSLNQLQAYRGAVAGVT